MRILGKIFAGMLMSLVGCGGERVVERVVEVKEVQVCESKVEEKLEISSLMDRMVGLTVNELGKERVYCGGIWVGADTVITADHCVEGVKKVRVMLSGGGIYDGLVDREDRVGDLGRIRVYGVSGHGIALVGGRGKVGDRLHIIGHARGLNFSYLQGWVSGYREMEMDRGTGEYMQVTAPIYYGDSGGGVFNERGELVGVTSFIYKVPNVGFAVMGDRVKRMME